MGAAKAAVPLSSYTYTLGASGNRNSVAELSGRTVQYGYDSLYRLQNETVTADPANHNGLTDVTGQFCTKWNERESTWRKSGHADEEVQARANRDDAAAN